MRRVVGHQWALAIPQVLATSDGTKSLYGLERLGVLEGGAWHYPQHDALGSVRQWTDAAAAVLAMQAYSPFGVPRTALGSAPWRFAGEWHDPGGLVYLRARWYNPAWGRFTQVDPFPATLATPATQHRYVYGLNNPVLYVDPTGQLPPAPPVGPWNDRAFEHACGAWLQHKALPWLYGIYTECDWAGRFKLDFATVARAYCAGEIAATYRHELDRADIIAGRIASCVPAVDDPILSVQAKREFYYKSLREDLLERDLLAAGFQQESERWLARYTLTLAVLFPALSPARATRLHHICTNKNRVAGRQWTPKFEKLLEGSGLTLDDPPNLVEVPAGWHAHGGHPEEYHEWVYSGMAGVGRQLDAQGAGQQETAAAFRGFWRWMAGILQEHPEYILYPPQGG